MEGREKKISMREKHQTKWIGCFLHAPTGDGAETWAWAPKGIKPVTWCVGQRSTIEPHWLDNFVTLSTYSGVISWQLYTVVAVGIACLYLSHSWSCILPSSPFIPVGRALSLDSTLCFLISLALGK